MHALEISRRADRRWRKHGYIMDPPRMDAVRLDIVSIKAPDSGEILTAPEANSLNDRDKVSGQSFGLSKRPNECPQSLTGKSSPVFVAAWCIAASTDRQAQIPTKLLGFFLASV